MGATKSITGLFANVCGRITRVRSVRGQLIAGQGTHSSAQGNPSLAHSRLRRLSLSQEWVIDQARWLLKRLSGQNKSPFSTMVGSIMSGILSPAYCPAATPQAIGRPRGDRRFAR